MVYLATLTGLLAPVDRKADIPIFKAAVPSSRLGAALKSHSSVKEYELPLIYHRRAIGEYAGFGLMKDGSYIKGRCLITQCR